MTPQEAEVVLKKVGFVPLNGIDGESNHWKFAAGRAGFILWLDYEKGWLIRVRYNLREVFPLESLTPDDIRGAVIVADSKKFVGKKFSGEQQTLLEV